MVKAKHQKAKNNKQTNKQSHSKKHGKQADISEFRVQLDNLGLKIIQVTADGNCLFRALADQIEGDEDNHNKYRSMVVDYIRDNHKLYEPFIEDEVPFDEYCKSMGEDGTWAGHMELHAASSVTGSNICIHRHNSPRWYIRTFDKPEAPMIHLSYHDGEHYNSVRSRDDTCSGPARPIIIKADADLSIKSNKEKASGRKSKREVSGNVISSESIKMVKAGSGCEDATKVEQVLQHVDGDIDVAIEFLIAERGSQDAMIDDNKFSDLVNSTHGQAVDNQDENLGQHQFKVEDETFKPELSCSDEDKLDKQNTFEQDEKKIPRNKACPCGSRKKYKSCCGSNTGKSSGRFSVNQTVVYGKSRKDKRQVRKAGSANALSSNLLDGGPPDMGALCI